MNTVTALGDQWERVLIASLHEKRKEHVQQAESCKAGGEYQAQFMRIVSMYDRMIAALAQPERVALSDAEAHDILCRAASHTEEWAESLDKEPSQEECSGELVRAILAAQGSTQPVIAEAARDDAEIATYQQKDRLKTREINTLVAENRRQHVALTEIMRSTYLRHAVAVAELALQSDHIPDAGRMVLP